jgi:trigger factor
MNINKTDLADLVSQITLTLEPEDYKKEFNKKLQSYAAKATIKGFRKGKVPVDVIKKMYGQSIFGDMLDELFNTALGNYFKDNNINYIAQPLMAEGQEQLIVEINKDKTYSLSYEIGLLPDFEIKGISSTDSYEYLVPQPAETFVEDEIKYLSRRLGKMEDAEIIQNEDLVTATATEMEDGKIKEGGLSKDAVIFVQAIEDESFKALLLSKKLNDSFEVEIGKLENKDLDYIKKNILGLSADYDLKEDDVFHFVIKKVSHLVPAELTDELIKENFNLENIEELKAEILKSHKTQSTPASESLLKKALMGKMLDSTNIQISETFTKKWLATQEKLDEEKMAEELPKFIKELKWTYIKDKIARAEGITVENEDIRQAAAARIKGYEAQYGKLPADMIKNIVTQWYSDRNEMFNLSEEVKTNKIFKHLFNVIQKDEKTISSEDFDKLFQAENV